MSGPVSLDAEAVVEMNVDLCADTGENSVLLDADGLAAAIARPWSGFSDYEAFPTMYEKAAALLHGIAARQVFENGNKRTAWVAALTLLELNGIDIGQIETVQSDMFVRAAALDHTLEVSDLAEWFEVAHRYEHVRLERDQPMNDDGFWIGNAEGGPLDGGPISVGAVAHLPMRGLVAYVYVGDDTGVDGWHAYAFGQRADTKRGVVGYFSHLGVIEGDPPRPTSSDRR